MTERSSLEKLLRPSHMPLTSSALMSARVNRIVESRGVFAWVSSKSNPGRWRKPRATILALNRSNSPFASIFSLITQVQSIGLNPGGKVTHKTVQVFATFDL